MGSLSGEDPLQVRGAPHKGATYAALSADVYDGVTSMPLLLVFHATSDISDYSGPVNDI